MAIDCLVLGAGQEVGKSCVVVSIGGKRIMFDCGMHMGYLDSRRYPDFSLISATGDFDSALTCIVITHFHLDHVGALPYFTEVCGYQGPIYMTYPTKALAPLMLEDYRKVMVERRGEEEQFSYAHIVECMKKVIPIDLKQAIYVDNDLQIRAYYAGHVLGAAMIYTEVGDISMVYTGDYNMTPDRHLGAAQIDRLHLDLLITESTYATTIRDSKYAREREFLKAWESSLEDLLLLMDVPFSPNILLDYSLLASKNLKDYDAQVHKCVAGGGKVLIPTFALGRAQELCILLDDYWERMNLKVPIYFSAGLTIQANMYYKMLIGWTSQKIKDSYTIRNPFDFKHVCPFERSLINAPGPCILFATPGMISGGFSLEVFKQWAPSERNLVTLPGYCVAGTIGHKLMSGKPTRIDLDKDTHIDVRCQIHQLSFSPHTDAKGIMDLVEFLSPQHVILVHGEKPKMASLKDKIQSELGIECYYPANNETVSIPTTQNVKLDATKKFIRSCTGGDSNIALDNPCISSFSLNGNELSELVRDEKLAEGILMMEKTKAARIVCEDEFLQILGVEQHTVRFAHCFPVELSNRNQLLHQSGGFSIQSTEEARSDCVVAKDIHPPTSYTVLQLLQEELRNQIKCKYIEMVSDHLKVDSVQIRVCLDDSCPYRPNQNRSSGGSTIYFCCSWSMCDEKLAKKCVSAIKDLDLAVRGT